MFNEMLQVEHSPKTIVIRKGCDFLLINKETKEIKTSLGSYYGHDIETFFLEVIKYLLSKE